MVATTDDHGIFFKTRKFNQIGGENDSSLRIGRDLRRVTAQRTNNPLLVLAVKAGDRSDILRPTLRGIYTEALLTNALSNNERHAQLFSVLGWDKKS